MEHDNLPSGAPFQLQEVHALVKSLDMTKEELHDGLVGIVWALETMRPGYVQAFLTTVLENRWRRQEQADSHD